MIDGMYDVCLLDKRINNKTLSDSTNISQPTNEMLHHLAKYTEWSSLVNNYKELRAQSLRQLFAEEELRGESFTINAANIEFNYSHQPINKKTIKLLADLASKYNLNKHIEKLFVGDIVNENEHKPALHTALRSNKQDVIEVEGEDINLKIQKTLSDMETISYRIRNNLWLKSKESNVTDIVNIGIGGSNLGPKMAVHALQNYKTTDINFHYISNSDPYSAEDLLKKLNKDTTIFIVASKSFTTTETIGNLDKVIAWFNDPIKTNKHIIAVTAHPEKALALNIKHVLPIWSWIGGRFSFFSAINLSLMISIGPEHFNKLLTGARQMDLHFRKTPFEENMPVLMALIGLWNINFFLGSSHLFLVYSDRLAYLTQYIQQLDMESNGKSMSTSNSIINYSTGPIVWGGLGNEAEHAYYQLLLQGTHYTPIDYIFVKDEKYEPMNKAAMVKLNALAFGNRDEQHPQHLENIRAGISKITLNGLTPEAIGALVSLYEHKTYCQSVMWETDAFDQPGVDAAKKFNLEI
ncbi:MAG: glucose-6-phosphate isomerase [Legionellaceae bacterium]|nr:glucose-6-phosphate isomerase [Legionellaceae bacterium]